MRDKVEMTEAETVQFLTDHGKVHVATLTRAGAPHVATLFYAVVDGLVSFWTYAASQKIRNLERDPRVSALVETGNSYPELRGVSIQGTAVLLREPDQVRRVGRAVAAVIAEQFGPLTMDEAELERQVGKRVAVQIDPTRLASWDHTKLGRSSAS